jgi:hypothetical protein
VQTPCCSRESHRTFGGDSSGCARSGGRTVPAGPWLSRFRCVFDGRGTVAGPGRAECSRPIPVSPVSGPASPRPATGIRPGPGRLHLHRPLRRRSLNAVAPTDGGSDVASCAVRDGLLASRAFALVPSYLRASAANGGSPCSPPLCHVPGVPRERLRCRPGVRSNSVATGCASAGLPCAAGVPREAFPLRLRRTGHARAGPAPHGSGGSPPLHPSMRPYPEPSTTVYPPAVPSRRRGRFRCVCDGRPSARRRPAVTGWVYGGDRALTSRFTPSLVWVGGRRRRAAPDGVRREGAARAPRCRQPSTSGRRRRRW